MDERRDKMKNKIEWPGTCEKCGKWCELKDGLCDECWLAEKAARNMVFMARRGVNHAKK